MGPGSDHQAQEQADGPEHRAAPSPHESSVPVDHERHCALCQRGVDRLVDREAVGPDGNHSGFLPETDQPADIFPA